MVVTVTSNDIPLAGAEISVSGTERTVTTDSQGRAEMGQLPAGAITGTVAADGYNNIPFSLTLEAGTTGRVSVIMTPLFEGELRVGPVTTQINSQTEQETV